MKPIVSEPAALTAQRERVASLVMGVVGQVFNDAPGTGHAFGADDVVRIQTLLHQCAAAGFSASRTASVMSPHIRQAVGNVRTSSPDIETAPYWNLTDAVGAVADTIPEAWPLMTQQVREARLQHALEHLADASHFFCSPRTPLHAASSLESLRARTHLNDALAAQREQVALLARQFVQRLLTDASGPEAGDAGFGRLTHAFAPNDVIYMRSALEFARVQNYSDSAALGLLAPTLRRAVVNLQQSCVKSDHALDTEPYWALVNAVAAIGDSVPGARPMMTEQDRAGRLTQARADLDLAANGLQTHPQAHVEGDAETTVATGPRCRAG